MNHKYILLLFRIGILLLFCYSALINWMIADEKYIIVACEVLGKFCHKSRGGSGVDVLYNDKEYTISIYGNECYDIEISEIVDLKYIPALDKMFFSQEKIKREMILYGIIFLLSLGPFKKIHKYFNTVKR